MPAMNDENIYWLFSAAAQSVAAFIALLLAGYALVHAQLESARSRDDTLEEVHLDLRRNYHGRLTLLACVNGAGIGLSLLVVYLNKWAFPGKEALMAFTAMVDVAAMTGGLVFVVKIVDPRRYAQAAARALKERSPEFELTGVAVDPTEFVEQFKLLSRAMRDLMHRRGLQRDPGEGPKRVMSFQAMLDMLSTADLIEPALQSTLADINKYRNLLYHGHFPEADRGMVERVRQAVERVRRVM